jgi:hypothetical protein
MLLQKMSYLIFIWSVTSNLQARHTELQVGRVTLQCSDKPVIIIALLNTSLLGFHLFADCWLQMCRH